MMGNTLNRFMSQAAEKCYYFFKAIGSSINFEWTQEYKSHQSTWSSRYNNHQFWLVRAPFGLKNTTSTYQRIVNIVIYGLIGDVMETYVDDMVIKSVKANNRVACLQKVCR